MLNAHAGGSEQGQAWSRVGTWAEAARDGALRAASKWQPAWAVLASYAPVAARLHLALFYFYGVYYHWAKRATGALSSVYLMACAMRQRAICMDGEYQYTLFSMRQALVDES